MSNKQSSVEWLIKKLEEEEELIFNHGLVERWKEQAKAMHKEEIMEAHYADRYGCFSKDYYNETYGGNNEQK